MSLCLDSTKIKDNFRTAEIVPLIKYYLQNRKSREYLNYLMEMLIDKYNETLDGETRIRLNHLDVLLKSPPLSDEILVEFFYSFLYGTGKGDPTIKCLNIFEYTGDDSNLKSMYNQIINDFN